MPNIKSINNHNRRKPHTCYVYTDEMALNAANNAAKKLRRGKTFHSEMSMSQKSLEILMNSYSDEEYDIVGTSEDGSFYSVTIHRYTLIERWMNKRNKCSKRTSATRDDIFSDVEAVSW